MTNAEWEQAAGELVAKRSAAVVESAKVFARTLNNQAHIDRLEKIEADYQAGLTALGPAPVAAVPAPDPTPTEHDDA